MSSWMPQTLPSEAPFQHAVTDYLSRLESGEPAETTYDDLPDASLFNITTMSDDNEDE